METRPPTTFQPNMNPTTRYWEKDSDYQQKEDIIRKCEPKGGERGIPLQYQAEDLDDEPVALATDDMSLALKKKERQTTGGRPLSEVEPQRN